MAFIDIFYSYIHYLVHPFKTHESFLGGGRSDDFKPLKLSVYESLGTSWVFIVFNAMFKLIILNMILVTFLDIFVEDSSFFSQMIDVNQYTSFYLLILSTILDVIFYPLFGFFIIQFWELIIKIFANLLGVEGDITEKTHRIISVSLSSNILKIIPIFGSPAQGLASMILMYAGLRKQLNTSPVLSFCILFSPIVIVLGLISVFVAIFLFLSF